MVTVSSISALKKRVVDGVLREPVNLVGGGSYEVDFLESFENLSLGDDVDLHQANNVSSLAGLKVSSGCSIFGLIGVKTLTGLIAGRSMKLSGLLNVTDFGQPILAPGCRIGYLEGLEIFSTDKVFWPIGTVLRGLDDDFKSKIPAWALNQGRVILK